MTASWREGRTIFVEIESQAGAECRLRNPFKAAVSLYRNGQPAGSLSGDSLRFPTGKGERITIVPADTRLETLRRSTPNG